MIHTLWRNFNRKKKQNYSNHKHPKSQNLHRFKTHISPILLSGIGSQKARSSKEVEPEAARSTLCRHKHPSLMPVLSAFLRRQITPLICFTLPVYFRPPCVPYRTLSASCTYVSLCAFQGCDVAAHVKRRSGILAEPPEAFWTVWSISLRNRTRYIVGSQFCL